MISDTLSDAVAAIDAYLADPATASAYIDPNIHSQIVALRTHMDCVRQNIDRGYWVVVERQVAAILERPKKKRKKVR